MRTWRLEVFVTVIRYLYFRPTTTRDMSKNVSPNDRHSASFAVEYTCLPTMAHRLLQHTHKRQQTRSNKHRLADTNPVA